eukprot:TRINITY_DN1104_c0_g1_i8.p2 TRINITY_DN1104_c0_g1~~TRINITY_DN1104_c0_g1_i8.p2  ORF type:complete len:111 (-),score=24.22 TRINITY_DN1104_c0_g1_i8:56-388(-)
MCIRDSEESSSSSPQSSSSSSYLTFDFLGLLLCLAFTNFISISSKSLSPSFILQFYLGYSSSYSSSSSSFQLLELPPEKSFTTNQQSNICLLYTSPSPRDRQKSRMPSSA